MITLSMFEWAAAESNVMGVSLSVSFAEDDGGGAAGDAPDDEAADPAVHSGFSSGDSVLVSFGSPSCHTWNQ